jgi:NADP-dependent 3-hydroxy acid dehydrogenase YdfG
MKFELQNLDNKVFLLTGGTSGIGRETVKLLMELGSKIVINARNISLINEIAGQFGTDQILKVAGDCAIPDTTDKMVNSAILKWGKIDGVIANAGVGFFGSVESGTFSDIVEVVNTNYLGTINLVRSSLPYLKKNKTSDIVIVSSAAGYRGNSNEAVYAGTKHAQVGFAGSLEREVNKLGIKVSLVCPAGTNTNFAIGRGRNISDLSLEEYMDPSVVAHQIITILRFPPSVRTQTWSTWSISQES